MILSVLGSIKSDFIYREMGVLGLQIILCTVVITTYILYIFTFFEVGLTTISKTRTVSEKNWDSSAMSSLPLQSAMFTINKKFFIGLVSSLITAAIGYAIRLFVLSYLEYDFFNTLNNWQISLSYFCSLGAMRFVINEWLKSTFVVPYSTATIGIYNNSAATVSSPVGTNAAGYNSSMQNPNNPSTQGSNNPSMEDSNNPSIGSSSTTNNPSELEREILKKESKMNYFTEQLVGINQELDYMKSLEHRYKIQGREKEWNDELALINTSLDETKDNLKWETRRRNMLQRNLENGNYNLSYTSTATSTKRSFNDVSMGNDNSSSASNTKRRGGNE